MSNSTDLRLYEEILLLALRDEKGTVASGTWLTQALGGALLAELLLEGRLRLERGSKKAKVSSSAPMGDALLDESLELIAHAKRPKNLAHWVAKLAGLKNLKHRAAEGLCARGILKAGTDKVLLFFERRVYPERDSSAEEAIVERLKRAIFGSGTVDAPTAVLIALADQTGILKVVFDRKKLARRKDRIRRIVEGEAIGKATKEVVEAIQAAVIVSAVIVPTIVS